MVDHLDMENKTIDLLEVQETLEREFNIFEYVEMEGEGVLRFDWGSGSSFWLYVNGASVSGEKPPRSKKMTEILKGFGFTQFDWGI